MRAVIVLCVGITVGLASACERTSGGSAPATSAPAGREQSGDVIRFDPASPQLERLRVAPVADAVLPTDEFDVPGTIEPLPTRVARLALPMPGRIRTVSVTLGDRVRQGQLLLTIETPDVSELQAAHRQARAEVAQRQAARAKAEADLDRARDLLANRAIAQKEVLTAETEAAAATAALEQAHAAQDDIARRLRLFGVVDDGRGVSAGVRSPLAGEVIEMTASPGEYRSDTAAPVVAVADLARVWVVASVPERAVGRIQAGQPVSVIVAAYPDVPFEGRISRIAGAVEPDTRSIRVMADLENRDGRLKAGMFARVRYTGPARAVVTVPAAAIVQDEGRTSVFVERAPGEFERRDVGVGPRRDADVVITSGLATGDRVVVDGTMLLMGQ